MYYTEYMKTSNLRKLREELKLTRLELAKHFHISYSAIDNYEKGRRRTPIEVASYLIDLAKEKGIDVDIKYFLS